MTAVPSRGAFDRRLTLSCHAATSVQAARPFVFSGQGGRDDEAWPGDRLFGLTSRGTGHTRAARGRAEFRRGLDCGQLYRSFNKDESAAGGVSGNMREASIPQTWVVGNVEHDMKEPTSFVHEYAITDLATWAVPPRMRPEQMNGSLERFVRDVAPRINAAAAAA
jgi:hypothetical protein